MENNVRVTLKYWPFVDLPPKKNNKQMSLISCGHYNNAHYRDREKYTVLWNA